MKENEEIQRVNEEIAIRFQKIETAFAKMSTAAGVFEALLAGIENEFSVPFVWLTLIDNEKGRPLIESSQTSEFLKPRLAVVSQELFENVLFKGIKPILANKDLRPFYRLMPLQQKYFVRSIAVVPFELDGRVAGVWNNGDADPDRFQADMDASLLFSLAGKISSKLTQLMAKNVDKETRPAISNLPKRF